jgi:hypothetical protein
MVTSLYCVCMALIGGENERAFHGRDLGESANTKNGETGPVSRR